MSIVIPVFNEEKRIGRGLREVLKFLRKYPLKTEVIIVCDGCKDGTPLLARRILKNSDPTCKIIKYDNNRGKGRAVKRGMQKAEGYYRLFLDVDLSAPITTLNSCEKYFSRDYPVIVGSRNLPDSSIQKNQPLYRRKLGTVFIILANYLLNLSISDYTCGFKVFRWDVADDIFGCSTIDGFAFDAEIMFLVKKRNHEFTEIPVRWCHDEETKVSLTKDIYRSFKDLIQIRLNEFIGYYD